MKRPVISIIMGSDSDLSVMDQTARILDEFKIPYELKVLSAHRSPEALRVYAKTAAKRGIKIIIAGAGGAAHLAGCVASQTMLPVIGVPMETRELKGIDSLFSTVQIPAGVPVATVSIGKSGAKNAAILALEVLSLADMSIKKRLLAHKKSMVKSIRQKNLRLSERENKG